MSAAERGLLDGALDDLRTALRAQNDAEFAREDLSMQLGRASSHAVECRHAVDKADARVRELLGGRYGV